MSISNIKYFQSTIEKKIYESPNNLRIPLIGKYNLEVSQRTSHISNKQTVGIERPSMTFKHQIPINTSMVGRKGSETPLQPHKWKLVRKNTEVIPLISYVFHIM